MAGALPRIVGDEGVALAHRRDGKAVDEVLYRQRHGVDVAGRNGDRLRQHAAFSVEDACGNVARFARRRAERGTDPGLVLLLDEREKAVRHHLHADAGTGIDGGNGALLRVSTRWPRTVTAATKAGFER